MHRLQRAFSPRSSTRAVVLAAVVALVTPVAAHAASVSYTVNNAGSPNGKAVVTFSTDTVAAGTPGTQRVTFTASGLVGLRPDTGPAGLPVFALKWDDDDAFLDHGPMNGSTPDEDDAHRYVIADEPEVAAWNVNAAGNVSGWVDLPTSIPTEGPGLAPIAGKHWIRFLSGAFSTTGQNLNGDKNVTSPITVVAPVSAVGPLSVGFTNSGGTFYPGTTFTSGADVITGSGLAYDASEPVTVKLGATTLTATNATGGGALTTDASGAFTANVTLPAGTTGGLLTFATTNVTHSATISRVASAVTRVTSATVRPGATVAVNATGFVGVAGAGQKVALVQGSTVLDCETADASGNAALSGAIASDTATGAQNLFVVSGAACIPMGALTDPVNRFHVVPLTVSVDAATVASTFKHVAPGGALPITGSGFASGESVAVKLDGATLGSALTASGTGTLTNSLTLPAGTALGNHTLTFTSATQTVVLPVKVIAAPVATITSATTVKPGATISFTLSGFVRGDGTAGQKVGVKIDAGDIATCVTTDASGAGTGTVTVPADTGDGEHTLRLLAGTLCVSGATATDLPGRSIAVPFQVQATAVATPTPVPTETPVPAATPTPVANVQGPTAAPAAAPAATPTATSAPAPTPGGTGAAPSPSSVKTKGAKLSLSLGKGTSTTAKVSVTSKSKYALTSTAKKKVVTLVKSSTVKLSPTTKTVELKLTADGKALLKRLGKLTVVVSVKGSDGKTVTRTLTLRA